MELKNAIGMFDYYMYKDDLFCSLEEFNEDSNNIVGGDTVSKSKYLINNDLLDCSRTE